MKELILGGRSIVIGSGSLEHLKDMEYKRVFIVTGEGSTFKYGTIKRITDILLEKGTCCQVYSGITKNPDTEAVEAGLGSMKEFMPDCIIAVGGGSAIDAAKVMVILYDYPELNFENIMQANLPDTRKTCFIAIPTTSGTGTEVTKSAVITFKKDNIKIGLKAKAFIPDMAILDASLTLSMPGHVVAETGMDAMTHAVECYINKNLDDFTECLAAGAVEGLYKYLPSSYKNGDAFSREKVHNYQCIAGCAFANVGLGMAHGISHSIGGMFNLGHGLINAIALPYVLEYNCRDEEVAERLKQLAARIGCEDFIAAISGLNRELGIPNGFGAAGIEENVYFKKLDILVENALKGSTRVNPVAVTTEEMRQVLTRLYKPE